jgi:hypothetical protein
VHHHFSIGAEVVNPAPPRQPPQRRLTVLDDRTHPAAASASAGDARRRVAKAGASAQKSIHADKQAAREAAEQARMAIARTRAGEDTVNSSYGEASRAQVLAGNHGLSVVLIA